GILLDTSGSMTPEKMSSARNAIDRFIYDLLGKDDELFFMQFASVPDLLQGWTFDRRAISRAVGQVTAGGGTAMYDAIAQALPIAGGGRHMRRSTRHCESRPTAAIKRRQSFSSRMATIRTAGRRLARSGT